MPRTINSSEGLVVGGKQQTVYFRTTKALYGDLVEAAHASGSSLAQELEYRLKRSLELDEIAGSLGYHDAFWVMLLVADALDGLASTGERWDDLEASRAKTLKLISGVLQDWIMPSPVAIPHGTEQGRLIGFVASRQLARAVKKVRKERSANSKRKPQKFPLP